MRFLSASRLATLAERLVSPAEWAWDGIAEHLLIPLLPCTAMPDSAIISDFPEIFAEFRGKWFSLLWRGGRDDFGAGDFHSRCDDHANTLTVVLETNGNVFGGFTQVEWANNCAFKADANLKSFLFTLKNPHNVPARRFALKTEKKDWAIGCFSNWGPQFCDIDVLHDCNANTVSFISDFGHSYANNTGLDGTTFFPGSLSFKVKEIEVFGITD
jgi:hypothetical protein